MGRKNLNNLSAPPILGTFNISSKTSPPDGEHCQRGTQPLKAKDPHEAGLWITGNQPQSSTGETTNSRSPWDTC